MTDADKNEIAGLAECAKMYRDSIAVSKSSGQDPRPEEVSALAGVTARLAVLQQPESSKKP